jgi:hypothetical protein
MPRQLLGGARVGRCEVREEFALAFVMGTHGLSGDGSRGPAPQTR